MREILFKGQQIHNKQWIEGSLIIDEKQNYYIGAYIKPEESKVEIGGRRIGKTFNRFIGIGFVQVIPETICQFTGLYDTQGNKIWENDIVNGIESAIDGLEHCFKVKVDFDFMHLTRIEYSNDIEVIGNIFDNPELLKGGSE